MSELRRGVNSISRLPTDVLTEIFLRFPAKTLLTLKSVCKTWYDFLSDPQFATLHVERSIATKTNLHFLVQNPTFNLADFDSFNNRINLNYPFKQRGCAEAVVMVGSCRGLLCLSGNPDKDSLSLYNPTTRTQKMLPVSFLRRSCSFNPRPNKDINDLYVGFGYVSATNEYKCVRILLLSKGQNGEFINEVRVYSLKRDSWHRAKSDAPYYFYNQSSEGTFVHETIHWIGGDKNRAPCPIVTFDLKDEIFESLALPNGVYNDTDLKYDDVCIGVLEESLCLMANHRNRHDLWIMKEYGVANSWTVLFSVSKTSLFPSFSNVGDEYYWYKKYIYPNRQFKRPICYSMCRQKVFVASSYFRNSSYVVSVDLDTNKVMAVKAVTVRDTNIICVENLLSLEKTQRSKRKNSEDRKEKTPTSASKGKKLRGAKAKGKEN